jgi:hypothetical protein
VTLYLSFRSQAVGGAVAGPILLQGNGTATPPALSVVPPQSIAGVFRGRSVLFATHGFNVSYQAGACALGNLETQLTADGFLRASDCFVGVLWPGDFWIPVINYPFSGGDAIESGKRLAAFCNDWQSAMQSVSFVSHSLGARLVLQAVSLMQRRARSVCLTAAAINRDCLLSEYERAAGNSDSISILSSDNDLVLKLAFAVGDPISDLLDPDHTPFEAALGFKGPPVPAALPIQAPWQTPQTPPYDHGNYLPPSDAPLPDPTPDPLWPKAVDFMGRAYRGDPQPWP